MAKIFIVTFLLLTLPLCSFAQNVTTKTSEKQINQEQDKNTAATTKENNPPKEIEAIINELKINEWGLDLSEFNIVEGKDLQDKIIKETYEQYAIPQSLYTSVAKDIFLYTVIFDKDSRKFWIHKTGGFAGVNIFYGPGYLDKPGKVKKKIN